jgi:hypothetical protein
MRPNRVKPKNLLKWYKFSSHINAKSLKEKSRKMRRACNAGTYFISGLKLVHEVGNAVEDFVGRFFEYKIFGKEKLLCWLRSMSQKILKPYELKHNYFHY